MSDFKVGDRIYLSDKYTNNDRDEILKNEIYVVGIRESTEEYPIEIKWGENGAKTGLLAFDEIEFPSPSLCIRCKQQPVMYDDYVCADCGRP